MPHIYKLVKEDASSFRYIEPRARRSLLKKRELPAPEINIVHTTRKFLKDNKYIYIDLEDSK
jgi:hypothetical protein